MHFDELIVFVIIINLILLAFVVGIVFFVMHYRKRKLESEKEKSLIKKEHEKQLLELQFEIQSQTMQEIGREIHDNVGQKLTLASLYTQQLDYENKYHEIHDRINAVTMVINESLSELRALSKNLTNQQIEQQPLKKLLEDEMERIKNISGYQVKTEIDINNGHSTLAKTIVFRIVQEFFQNSIKHAKADILTLQLNHNTQNLYLLLKDNGKGFVYESEKHKGIGLENMKKRAAMLGAQIQIQSEPGIGTALTLIIPNEKLKFI